VAELYNNQFGYLWWIDESTNTVFMWGHGGQFVIAAPDKNLVVAITSEVNTQSDSQFRNPYFWFDRIAEICN